MTVPNTPDVALPGGADPEHIDNWETGGVGTTRLVWSTPMTLPDNLASYDVRLVASQRLDGTIVFDDAYEGPLVYIGGEDYTPTDARLIAKALSDAADLADRWTEVTS